MYLPSPRATVQGPPRHPAFCVCSSPGDAPFSNLPFLSNGLSCIMRGLFLLAFLLHPFFSFPHFFPLLCTFYTPLYYFLGLKVSRLSYHILCSVAKTLSHCSSSCCCSCSRSLSLQFIINLKQSPPFQPHKHPAFL